MRVQKTKAFGKDLHIGDFHYSRGWLQKFKVDATYLVLWPIVKQTALIRQSQVRGDNKLQDLATYDPNDVYNMDDTGLFYRLQPNATLATVPVSGLQKQKDRTTIVLCSNSTGTDKMTPLCHRIIPASAMLWGEI